ncbi:ADP/ATP-dependent (S)-NAD(P)H-hydrate dehydratase, partial [Bradyrhizobium sp. AT1]|uniref:ADP-dependent NAD(P)H-hydrate dehydratase n=1 Tax=Bradyrhizobium sp. AT1 TaxID=574934 RepID=UPI0018DE2108
GALTAVMVRPVDTAVEFGELLGDKRYGTCIIGPGAGVGERTCDLVHTALGAQRHLVLDADALTSFAARPERLFESIKSSGDKAVVLTPHEGEFPRLFSDLSNKFPGRSKLERVRTAAERCGAVVLLKGPDTTIAAPDGRATIAANAPPWLATAGAGDVLSGIIAGLLAQGVPAFEAASIGVWMHGEAAREAGPGLIAEDLTETLPAVHRRIYDALGVEY